VFSEFFTQNKEYGKYFRMPVSSHAAQLPVTRDVYTCTLGKQNGSTESYLKTNFKFGVLYVVELGVNQHGRSAFPIIKCIKLFANTLLTNYATFHNSFTYTPLRQCVYRRFWNVNFWFLCICRDGSMSIIF